MSHAVIKTGGKQYLVSSGERVRVDKLKSKTGEKITIEDVLLVSTGKTVKVGQPTVKGATVAAKVVANGKSPKVFGVKMKAKKRNKKYFGHRQQYTELEITSIKSK
jgi:large subunit ribosomal protein L21